MLGSTGRKWAAQGVQVKESRRYRAVDALRGVIMMIMAIDHASMFIARQHGAEFWAGAMSAYSEVFPFLTRWITHVCAPGFFFLMGAGICWSGGVGRTVKRGVLLMAIAVFMETPMMYLQSFLEPAKVSLNRITEPPPGDGSQPYFGLVTLAGLAMVMMACGLLLKAKPWMWLAVSAVCVAATNSLLPATGQPGAWWMALLLAPGTAQHLIVIYPLIPWLAAASAGMYFGWWWRKDPERAEGRVWLVGAALVAAGMALRAAGGWGNIRVPRSSGWIEFLNNVKYPPSAVFLTMEIGLALLLLWVLARLPESVRSERSPLIVFGQTPLFFYLAHFCVLMAVALVFFREALPLEGAYAVWALLLVALYPVCERYRRFKMSRPRESLWRLF